MACYRAGVVAFLSVDAALTGSLPAVSVPKGLMDVAFTPDGKRLLVVCEKADCVVSLPVPALPPASPTE